MNLDCKWGAYTPRERLDIMLGKNLTPFYFWCRCGWAAFALWTMSVPGTECYIPPHGWLILVALYYFYPA